MTEGNTTTGRAATAADLEFTIWRVFDAPRHLVFKAWTEPERMMHWCSPQGFTPTCCEVDLRAGGAWRCCMRSPEGTEHMEQGVYREIVEPERLVFTHAWKDAGDKPGHETRVTVTFAEHRGKTTVGFHQAVCESVRVARFASGGLGRVPGQTRRVPGERLRQPVPNECQL